MSFWPFVAGGATIIIFLLVVTVCCIVLKRNNQPYYANSQQVQGANKDQIIYENDHEFRKNISKGKRQFSSVYINKPENKVAVYMNSAQEDETYANCTDNDYENVE
ncbi:hypothetical protein G5714_005595 [Onychostoma macrolepis]|uniref:Uncharacterized protein n=1 Tax=Onychostoma macrolepis TaxID=369639 RepID=A0A7J6D1G7_9TELE|nr:hypothetical protein G5714_005595 [Onychostoma macrolepis]